MGLFSSFKKLTDDQLRRVSLSAQYQYQQGGEHFALSAKLGSRAKAILEQGWGIADKADLRETVEELIERNHSTELEIVKEEMAAELQEDAEIDSEEKRIVSMAAIIEKHDADLLVEMETYYCTLCNYIDALDALLANQLISSWDSITARDLMGWDLGRAAFLVRLGVDRKLFKSDEAWELLEKIYQKAIANFNDWEDFGRSYIIGRSLWADSKDERDVLGFCNALKWLMKHPESPWMRVRLK